MEELQQSRSLVPPMGNQPRLIPQAYQHPWHQHTVGLLLFVEPGEGACACRLSLSLDLAQCASVGVRRLARLCCITNVVSASNIQVHGNTLHCAGICSAWPGMQCMVMCIVCMLRWQTNMSSLLLQGTLRAVLHSTCAWRPGRIGAVTMPSLHSPSCPKG